MEKYFDFGATGLTPESLMVDPALAERFAALMEPSILTALVNAQGEIESRIPFGATGDLGRSLEHEVVTRDGDQRGYVRSSGEAGAYSNYVEFGRAPGKMPPWDEQLQSGGANPFYKWVEHVVTATANASTGKVQRKTPARDAAIRGASFLIARAIGERGVKGRHPFEEGWEAAQSQTLVILTAGLAKTMSILSGGANA